MPWVQPGLCCGGDEEPRSCGEPAAGRPAGGCPGEGGSPLEGPSLQEWMHPGECVCGDGWMMDGCQFIHIQLL